MSFVAHGPLPDIGWRRTRGKCMCGIIGPPAKALIDGDSLTRA